MRSAAEVDEHIAVKRTELHRIRLANLTRFVEWVAATGPLRAALLVDEAAATVWATTGPDMHRTLVDSLGRSHEQFVGWIADTLGAVLLPPRS